MSASSKLLVVFLRCALGLTRTARGFNECSKMLQQTRSKECSMMFRKPCVTHSHARVGLNRSKNQLKLGTAWTVTLWSPSPRISTTHLPSLVESKWGRLSTDARCYQSCAMFAVGKLWRGTNALRTGIRRRSQEPNHMKQTVGGFSKTWVSAIQDGKEKNSL